MPYNLCCDLYYIVLCKCNIAALITRYKTTTLILLSIPLLTLASRLNAENVYRLPPAPVQQDNHTLATIHKIKIKRFVFEGNTIFTDIQLQKIAQDYLEQLVSIEQLMELKQKITRYYVDQGYINSGAILPDQEVKSGIIQFKIVEGKLNRIQVRGNQNIAGDYLTAKIISLNEGQYQPLNLFALQKSLKLLEQSPLIDKVDAQLSPGIVPGQSNLDVKIDEAKPYRISFKANNHRSPSIGAEVGQIEASHLNLFGYGEHFYLNYGLLDNQDDFLVNFSVPLNAHKTRAAISIERDSSVVLTEPFNSLGFSSELKRFSASLSHR